MWAVLQEWANVVERGAEPRLWVFELEAEARGKIVTLMQEAREPWLPALPQPITLERFDQLVNEHEAGNNNAKLEEGMVQHWEVDPDHEQWIGEQGSWRIVEITPDKKLFHWGFDGSDRNTFVNLFSEEDLRVAKVNGVSLGDGDDYILDLTTVTKPGECQMTKALGKDGQLIVP